MPQPPLLLTASVVAQRGQQLLKLAKDNERLIAALLDEQRKNNELEKTLSKNADRGKQPDPTLLRQRAVIHTAMTDLERQLRDNNASALELRDQLASNELANRERVQAKEVMAARLRSIVAVNRGTTSSTVDIQQALNAVPAWVAATVIALFVVLLAKQAAPSSPAVSVAALSVASLSCLMAAFKLSLELKDRWWTSSLKKDNDSQGNAGRQSYVGDLLCASGAFSGSVCLLQVVNPNVTVRSNSGIYYNEIQVEQTNRDEGPGNGDSGGPVFAIRSDGAASARGLVSAGNRSTEVPCKGVVQEGRVCTWRSYVSNLPMALTVMKLAVNTGSGSTGP